MLIAPLATVFAMALEKGYAAYLESFKDEATAAAIRLTLMTAVIVVPLNKIFGPAGVLCHRQTRVPRQELPDHADRPATHCAATGDLGHGLRAHVRPAGLALRLAARTTTSASSYAVPGIVLATMFVTFLYVARELIPLTTQW